MIVKSNAKVTFVLYGNEKRKKERKKEKKERKKEKKKERKKEKKKKKKRKRKKKKRKRKKKKSKRKKKKNRKTIKKTRREYLLFNNYFCRQFASPWQILTGVDIDCSAGISKKSYFE